MVSQQAEQLQQVDQLQTPKDSGSNANGQAGTAGQPSGSAQTNSAPGQPGFGSQPANAGTGAVPQGFASGGMGAIAGGGIAGVASKAGGKTIKVVNDQTDYSLWEFYYDPSKDLARGAGANAMAPGGALGQTGAQGNAPQNTNSGFGASTSTLAPQNPTEGTTGEPQSQGSAPQPQPQAPLQPQGPQPQNPQQQAPQPQQPPE